MVPADVLGKLPNLQYFASVSGGRIIKGRFPILDPDANSRASPGQRQSVCRCSSPCGPAARPAAGPRAHPRRASYAPKRGGHCRYWGGRRPPPACWIGR